jgi:hypothetical protein
VNARVSFTNPWDIPSRFLAPPVPEDRFADVHSEEAVLSHLLWKGIRPTELTMEHFTGHDRQIIFLALADGVPYETIERLEIEAPGYVTDLFFAPANAPTYLREAREQLERMKGLRELNRRVEAWQRRAPMLSIEKARVELAAVLKGAMGE